MPRLLRQFQTLGEPVTSPSGKWALRYDTAGRAVIADRDGTITWSAGAVGTLRLELEGVFTVYHGGQVAWRADLPVRSYSSLHVADDGDGIIYDDGLPIYSVLHGPVEPVSLGDRAPVAEIRANRVLTSGNGKRTVTRNASGDGLVHKRRMGKGAALVTVVQPAQAQALEQPGTWLTWRFIEKDGHCDWALVLVGPDDDVRWVLGNGHAGEPPAAAGDDSKTREGDGSPRAWLETGLGLAGGLEGGYCVTVIHNLDPDEALRRFGADDSQIATSTWAELLRRASYEEASPDDRVVAAFGLGRHTLLVENNGYQGTNRPDLSRGTFAVSSYSSWNLDQNFLVTRDGEILATFDENMPNSAWGAEPWMVEEALSEMSIDDPAAFDDDDGRSLDDLELLCRLVGIHPTIADVTGPARVAILPG
jgi:hypothetical protein